MFPPTFTALLLAALALRPASGSFSLNTAGPDWDYTAVDLANTTSEACKQAYSASIDCTDTLVGLVASMRPGFDPQSADFDAMCTSSCSDALDAYVAAVKSACNQPGDLADEAQGNTGVPKDPVWVVGEVFQYKYAQSCAKDDSGAYCYFTSQTDDSSFACSDTCSVQFYANAHNQPGSAWMFNYYYLVPQSPWWEQQFAAGWATAKACGAVDENPSGNSTSASTPGASGTATETAMASAAPSVTQTGTLLVTPSSSLAAATHSSSSAAAMGAVRGMWRPLAGASALLALL